MELYTKGGDQGWTSMLNKTRVSKTDERIELIGTIDELNSHIGLAKVQADHEQKQELSRIQQTLMQIMTEISYGNRGKYRLEEGSVLLLENQIDELETKFCREKKFVLYGGCEFSARLDVARAVARRAERQFYRMVKVYSADPVALQYMNRLADYLYILARYSDFMEEKTKSCSESDRDTQALCTAVVKEVLKNIH